MEKENTNTPPSHTQKKNIIKEIVSYALIFLFCFFIFPHFIANGVQVDGSSMEPTLSDKQRLIVEKISPEFNQIDRFDIITFDPHNEEDKYWIKRVIGLPGEIIQIIDSEIYINGCLLEENYGLEAIEDPGIAIDPIKLKEDEYFVLGDNRNDSTDSRWIGPIPKKYIDGHAIFRFWPFNSFGTLK